MLDGAKLLLVNTFAICMMIPVMEHFGGRSLPPGVEMVFFWVGAIGLAVMLTVLGLLRLRLLYVPGRKRGGQ
jgi:hypothetical protein